MGARGFVIVFQAMVLPFEEAKLWRTFVITLAACLCVSLLVIAWLLYRLDVQKARFQILLRRAHSSLHSRSSTAPNDTGLTRLSGPVQLESDQERLGSLGTIQPLLSDRALHNSERCVQCLDDCASIAEHAAPTARYLGSTSTRDVHAPVQGDALPEAETPCDHNPTIHVTTVTKVDTGLARTQRFNSVPVRTPATPARSASVASEYPHRSKYAAPKSSQTAVIHEGTSESPSLGPRRSVRELNMDSKRWSQVQREATTIAVVNRSGMDEPSHKQSNPKRMSRAVSPTFTSTFRIGRPQTAPAGNTIARASMCQDDQGYNLEPDLVITSTPL
ncbi:uncharacterized protein LOC135811689 [Sycon ciliatum]|uniref:uncharacterized protein LOC135811689 n=1 Tax=Sycon ciliatum TaxID=27933 RepID=UPI0031F71E7E